MQIYLIRHAQPKGIDGLCYGRLNVSVEDSAIVAAATAIADVIPSATLDSASIYCSPLARCLVLAQRLAAPKEPEPSDDLIEMNFGAWEGRRWDEIPKEQIDAWAAELWDYRPGGGESARMVRSRWQRWVQAIRRRREKAVVAVTHAGVIRVALADLGLEMPVPAMEAPIPFGSVHCLKIS